MKIKVQKALKAKKGLLVLPLFQEQLKKIPADYPKKFIKERVSEGFEANAGESIFSYVDLKNMPSKLMIFGFGAEGKFDAKKARELGAKIAKSTNCQKESELTLAFTGPMGEHVQEIVEGILMAQYRFKTFKSKPKEPECTLAKLNLITYGKRYSQEIEVADAVASGVAVVQDLVNSPSNYIDSYQMAREARRIAKRNKYKIAILKEKDLRKMKWGGILAVNQGSEREAHCLVLEYNGAKKKTEKPIVLVGKGVIFDTGGYNLKRTGAIEKMHQDMAGAATVLGVFEMLRDCKIEKNVVGIMPVAENMISALSYKPSDIITMYSGKTVEVTNTDAEGRLLLADAIHYGTKLNPQCIITIATLTGAVGVATGNRYCGLIGNNDELRFALEEAGKQVDDLGWPLPICDDYRKRFDSQVADIRNCDVDDRTAGSSKAACFLERFVGDNDWCHIDIGGTAFTKMPKPYQQKGATAHGLRMLLRFLENQS